MADTQSMAAMKRRIAGIEADLAALSQAVGILLAAERDEQRAAGAPAFYNIPEGTSHGS